MAQCESSETAVAGEVMEDTHSQPESEGSDSAAYTKLVQESAELLKELNKLSLRSYWTMGQRVLDLQTNDENKYGSRTLDKFARDLQATCRFPLGTASLYKMALFAKYCLSETELEKLIRQGWSWRNVSFIYNNSVPANVRRHSIAQVEAGELSIKKAVESVREATQRQHEARQPKPDVWARRLSEFGTSLCSELTAVPHMIEKLENLSVSDRKTHLSALEAARQKLDEVERSVAAARAAIAAMEAEAAEENPILEEPEE
jgi:hypothetical protein